MAPYKAQKPTMESRVLVLFEQSYTDPGRWYTPQQKDIPDLTHAQIVNACERLERKGLLEKHLDSGLHARYRLPQGSLRTDPLEAAVLSYFNKYPGTAGTAACFGPELIANESERGWTVAAVDDACVRLVRKKRLQYTITRGFFLPDVPSKTEDEDPLETAIMAYFKQYSGTVHAAHALAPELVVFSPGRTWTAEDVSKACDRLVKKNLLRYKAAWGYFLPDATRLWANNGRPDWQSVLSAPLDGRLKALVTACEAALYQDEAHDEVTEENMASRIALLRENREQLKKLVKEYQEKQVDAAVLKQEGLGWLAQYTAEAHAHEKLKKKIAVLDACHRGLFGERSEQAEEEAREITREIDKALRKDR